MKEIAEMALKQKKVTDKLFQRYLDELEKLEVMLSNFHLYHLNDNEIEKLLGFIPHSWNDEIDIIKKKSEIFLTYTVCKSEEDFQNYNTQKITLPLSTVDKYINLTANYENPEA